MLSLSTGLTRAKTCGWLASAASISGSHAAICPASSTRSSPPSFEIEVPRDREGRRALIAGDHHRADAGAMQLFQRRHDAGADRIGDAGEAEPDEIPLVARIAAGFADRRRRERAAPRRPCAHWP